MKKKVKKVKRPVIQTIGVVNVNYVQVGVPQDMIASTIEALSQLILSDYYRQFGGIKLSDD